MFGETANPRPFGRSIAAVILRQRGVRDEVCLERQKTAPLRAFHRCGHFTAAGGETEVCLRDGKPASLLGVLSLQFFCREKVFFCIPCYKKERLTLPRFKYIFIRLCGFLPFFCCAAIAALSGETVISSFVSHSYLSCVKVRPSLWFPMRRTRHPG